MRGDDGTSSSLTAVLLTPVFVVLAFAAFQAAMWGHARTEARVIARDTAALVARSGVLPSDARESAMTILAADTDLRRLEVSVDNDGQLVTVTVTGAPQESSVARRPTSRSPLSFRSKGGRREARFVGGAIVVRPKRSAWS